MESIKPYLTAIEGNLKRGNATEHTHRPALKTLIESLGEHVTATNEPKREQCGAPDFIVTRHAIPLGYIEAKDVGKPLDAVEKDEQLRRYRESLGNLLLTDYLEFRWYVGGAHRLTARLAKPEPSGKLKIDKEGVAQVAEILSNFLNEHIPLLHTPKDLACRMAALARLIRSTLTNALNDEECAGGLHMQMEGFRKVLLHDLTEAQFADMYAQTICYGLFAARCNARLTAGNHFVREQAAFDLPKTNPFLRRMFNHIAGPELDGRIVWIVDDLTTLLDRTDMEGILRDFGRRTRQEDPIVHFYETFLAAYDPKMREARGVYYTPEPVVSYIVRSVDQLLKTDFALPDGLADTGKIKLTKSKVPSPPADPKDPRGPKGLKGEGQGEGGSEIHRVLILDPATGTGTFLHGVIDQIHDHISRSGQIGAWAGAEGYVARHLLPRIFGFELLMAPYAVAHMKLGLQLAQYGYDFGSDERLRIYLTNTLEEAYKISDLPLFTQWLVEEVNAAGAVKQEAPVMVILGNPPYSGHSANTGPWIAQLLRGKDGPTELKTDNYFEVDGRPLGEKNPKWLNDDYVKFIRFAQWRIEKTGYGILAFITNHGYLDNPTFRGMRRSLMKTFDDIYLLDLHGNSKKKERCPDGSKDENVFDIQQGVAIGIFVKRKAPTLSPPPAPSPVEGIGADLRFLTELNPPPLRGEGKGEGEENNDFLLYLHPPLHPLPSKEGRFGCCNAPKLALLPIEGEGNLRGMAANEHPPVGAASPYFPLLVGAAPPHFTPLTGATPPHFPPLAGAAPPYFPLLVGAAPPHFTPLTGAPPQHFPPLVGATPPHFPPLAGAAPPHFPPLAGGTEGGGNEPPNNATIRHAHLWGLRELYGDAPEGRTLSGGKYHWLWENDLATTAWRTVTPQTPFYLFIPQDENLRAEYERGWKVTEMMPVNVLGFQTHRDHFAIDFDKDILRSRINELKSTALSDDELRDRYQLQDNRDWQLTTARNQLRRLAKWEDHLITCLYRPFDFRFCYFSQIAMDYPRRELIEHVVGKINLCLNVVRQTKMETWQHAVVSNAPSPAVYVEVKDGSNLFPLYLYTAKTQGVSLFDRDDGTIEPMIPTTNVNTNCNDSRRPNLAPAFIKDFSARLGMTFIPDGKGDRVQTFGPEDVFFYMYAVFHSPAYRKRYAEFLKIDFPRLPLTNDADLFRALCGLGEELTTLHLLEKTLPLVTAYPVAGDNIVKTVQNVVSSPSLDPLLQAPWVRQGREEHNESSSCQGREVHNGNSSLQEGKKADGRQGTGRVWINKTQYFEGVPPEVWGFHIGGYQVCQKWLKDRKGRKLSWDDITHYQRIVAALAETIRLMEAVDETIAVHSGWPL